MAMVHKSVDVRAEVWRKLRLHAELSGVPPGNFLTYVIERSSPVSGSDADATAALRATCEANRSAAARATAQHA